MQPSIRRPSPLDLLVAGLALALTVPVSLGLVREADLWLVVVLGLLTLVLAACVTLRRLHPVGCYYVTSLVMFGMVALPNLPDGPSVIFLPLSLLYLVMLYTVVAETGTWVFPLAVSVAGLGLVVLRTAVDPPEPLDWSAFWVFIPAAAAAIASSWAFGAYHRARIELQQRRLREGMRRERELIAREVHDVVAHSLAVVVTQSDAALMVLDRDPQKAREMFGTALRTGREAMTEMRRVVNFLRDEPSGVSPVQSMDDLEALVASFRSAGVRVDLWVSGAGQVINGEAARATYRIVQESLTNAVKHSPRPVRCRVTVDVEPEEVRVSVRDDGPGIDATRSGSNGLGIAGMRERVRSVGGELEITADGAGTQVAAWLPRT